MQNSSGFDFHKILDQTLYTYLPEKFTKLEEKHKNVNATENGKNLKLGLVNRLRTVVEWIALSEVIVGSILLILLMLLACHYDKLYGTENSRLISLMSFGGSVLLVVNGMMLLTSLKLDKKKVMWYYILMSTLLWIYLFVLSVMKIHFALLVIERDTYKVLLPENRHFLLSNACVVGVATMLGSVVHFIGNVTVFTYYNLKYIQPILFSCDTYKVLLPENRHFLLSDACVFGVATMLGSVVHFIGNVTVFTYYNLKYIQPILFSCGP